MLNRFAEIPIILIKHIPPQNTQSTYLSLLSALTALSILSADKAHMTDNIINIQ